MIVILDTPDTREALAEEIGTYPDTIRWIEKQLFVWVFDDEQCDRYGKYSRLDPYLIWAIRQATSEEFRMKGRSKDRRKFRLRRKKLLHRLEFFPEQFSSTTFLKSLKGDRTDEAYRVVIFDRPN